MVDTIQSSNGTITLEDLANYTVIPRPVAEINYRGLNLHSIGSPGGGAVLLNVLKIMEQYDAKDWEDVQLSNHRFDEALRFSYGARLELGDPDFVRGILDMETRMLDEETARRIHSRIMDNQTQPVESYNPKKLYTSDTEGTSHIVTADASGMATSMTTTVNLLFGAQIMDPITGIIV